MNKTLDSFLNNRIEDYSVLRTGWTDEAFPIIKFQCIFCKSNQYHSINIKQKERVVKCPDCSVGKYYKIVVITSPDNTHKDRYYTQLTVKIFEEPNNE